MEYAFEQLVKKLQGIFKAQEEEKEAIIEHFDDIEDTLKKMNKRIKKLEKKKK